MSNTYQHFKMAKNVLHLSVLIKKLLCNDIEKNPGPYLKLIIFLFALSITTYIINDNLDIWQYNGGIANNECFYNGPKLRSLL